jgi:hypothetical protein
LEKNFIRVRNFVMLELLLGRSGCRTDILRNLTVQEMGSLTKDKNGFSLIVGNYKTAQSDTGVLTFTEKRLKRALM